MKRLFIFAAAFALALPAIRVTAATPVQIGLLAALSGPQAILGDQVKNGFMLAVDEENDQLGGVPVHVIPADSQFKPGVAVQRTQQLIEQDNIKILTGPVFSNIALAVVGQTEAHKVFFISPNAGPAKMAGKDCSPYFFSTSWENEQPHEAMGIYLQRQDVKKVYLVSTNYAAGLEAIKGFKRGYKGQIVGTSLPSLEQLDFLPIMTQIANSGADAVYVFVSGGQSVNFIKQYAASGLTHKIPLYSSFVVNSITLPAIGKEAIGTFQVNDWAVDLDNPQNKAFVKAYEKKYGSIPTNFAAQAYDTAKLIGSALRATHGDVSNQQAFEAALKKADFKSVRGSFEFGPNNFPINDYYLMETVAGPNGTAKQVLRSTIVKNFEGPYASECRMKPIG